MKTKSQIESENVGKTFIREWVRQYSLKEWDAECEQEMLAYFRDIASTSDLNVNFVYAGYIEELRRIERQGNEMKIKWTVGNAPTGMYRSFQHRSWPTAEDEHGNVIAQMRHPKSYTAALAVYAGENAITVYIADWYNAMAEVRDKNKPAFEWRKLKKNFNCVGDAKRAVATFFKTHPEFKTPGE